MLHRRHAVVTQIEPGTDVFTWMHELPKRRIRRRWYQGFDPWRAGAVFVCMVSTWFMVSYVFIPIVGWLVALARLVFVTAL